MCYSCGFYAWIWSIFLRLEAIEARSDPLPLDEDVMSQSAGGRGTASGLGGEVNRAPANRSTESVSDEEVWRVRFGVRTAKNLDRLVSESDPEDEAGELDAHRIGETLPM